MHHTRVLILMIVLLNACTSPAPVPPQAMQSSASPESPKTTATAVAPTPVRVVSSEAQEGASGALVDLYAQAAQEFPPDLEWLNTPQPLTMAGLHGKIVLLDFWTYGCVNCLHNFPELEQLLAEHPNELVVIGIHSGKFTHERETSNLAQIVQRYGLSYPIVNDSKRKLWYLWEAQAWPTLFLIDATGNVAGVHIGEGVYRDFKPLILQLIQEAKARGRLNREPLAKNNIAPPASVLAFPGKLLADPQGTRLFIADSNHQRIVIANPDTGEVLDLIGTGQAALRDGTFSEAALANPQGMALSRDGRMLYIADAGNHAVRVADLQTRSVTTLLGTGEKAALYPPRSGVGPNVALSSPWDLALDQEQLYIAMAGSHQIWAYRFADKTSTALAGNSVEGTADGVLAEAQFAQPSALARSETGQLYLADTEASSIRMLKQSGSGEVITLAGGGRDLFSFGDSDGPASEARFQHPQGIALDMQKQQLFVADTYNSKIKLIDLAAAQVRTLFGSTPGWRDGMQPLFNEPGGISLATGRLFVADTNNHAVRIIDLATRSTHTLVLKGIERFTPKADQEAYQGTRIMMPEARIAPGEGILRLNIELPEGYKVNQQAPSTLEWTVNGAVATLPNSADRSLAGLSFPIDIPVIFQQNTGAISAAITLIYCKAIAPDLCLIEEVQITAPLVISVDGGHVLELRHRVTLP